MGNCLRGPRTVLDPILMSDDTSPHVAIGQNQPLQTSPEVWRTEIPWTEGQLRGKRDTFWETAPAYDGRKEIWDALKAACEAVEDGDFGLAQAIVDGANISLPTGRLVEAYDELGSRYVVPKYCISKPTNLAEAPSVPPQRTSPSGPPAPPNPATSAPDTDDSNETDSGTNLLLPDTPSSIPNLNSSSTLSSIRRRANSGSSSTNRTKQAKRKTSKSRDIPSPASGIVTPPTGDPVVIKIRVSTLPKDIKMTMQASDRVRDLKRRLEVEHEVPAGRITMLYSGRVLNDRAYIKHLDIPKGFIIQAIVS